MTMELFSVIITIFLFGGIADMFYEYKGEIDKKTMTWKKIYTQRAFSTVVSTALVWYIVIQFHLMAVIAFVLLALMLIACLLLNPTKRKFQQLVAEKREKKKQARKQELYEILDEYRKEKHL